jgi:hypothetical protein
VPLLLERAWFCEKSNDLFISNGTGVALVVVGRFFNDCHVDVGGDRGACAAQRVVPRRRWRRRERRRKRWMGAVR